MAGVGVPVITHRRSARRATAICNGLLFRKFLIQFFRKFPISYMMLRPQRHRHLHSIGFFGGMFMWGIFFGEFLGIVMLLCSVTAICI